MKLKGKEENKNTKVVMRTPHMTNLYAIIYKSIHSSF